MARPKQHFEESLGATIYDELLAFIQKEKAIPGMRAFWRYMINPIDDKYTPGLGYDITWGEFRYHWKELQVEQRIKNERLTGALKVADVDIVIRNSP